MTILWHQYVSGIILNVYQRSNLKKLNNMLLRNVIRYLGRNRIHNSLDLHQEMANNLRNEFPFSKYEYELLPDDLCDNNK